MGYNKSESPTRVLHGKTPALFSFACALPDIRTTPGCGNEGPIITVCNVKKSDSGDAPALISKYDVNA